MSRLKEQTHLGQCFVSLKRVMLMECAQNMARPYRVPEILDLSTPERFWACVHDLEMACHCVFKDARYSRSEKIKKDPTKDVLGTYGISIEQ